MIKLYKDKRGTIVSVAENTLSCKAFFDNRWHEANRPFVEIAIAEGSLVLIGNNFRLK